MKQFEIGKEYFTTSICNHSCIFTIKVTGRTAKTISYEYEGDNRRSKIRIDPNSGCEYIQPDRYSMAPVFHADQECQHEPPAGAVAVPAPVAECIAPSNIIMFSQPVDNGAIIIRIGQRVECVCGACYPAQGGTVAGFEVQPGNRFSSGGAYAVICWDDCPECLDRVKLSQIHQKGWKSDNGSPLGIFAC